MKIHKLLINDKGSHPEVFCKNGVIKHFSKFTGKHLCQSLRPATLLKKDSGTGVFL